MNEKVEEYLAIVKREEDSKIDPFNEVVTSVLDDIWVDMTEKEMQYTRDYLRKRHMDELRKASKGDS